MKKYSICLDCGHYFSMTANQKKHYKAKKQNIPTHCPMCRELRWKEKRMKNRWAKKFERGNKNE